MDNPRTFYTHLEEEEIRHMETKFFKATIGMTPVQKDRYVDGKVMEMVHRHIHDIDSSARNHAKHGMDRQRAIAQAKESGDSQSAEKKALVATLKEIVKEYGNYPVTDPTSDIVTHIKGSHPTIAKVIGQLKSGVLNPEQAAAVIISQIGQDPEHSPHEIGYSKSSSAKQFGVGMSAFPSIPYTANARSNFRPSPKFLLDYEEAPDERFVKFLMATKGRGFMVDPKEESELRTVNPQGRTNDYLANKIGIPDLAVGPDGSISQRGGSEAFAKSCRALDRIMKQVSSVDRFIGRNTTVDQRVERMYGKPHLPI